MPKKRIDFSIPINVLIRDDGTKQALIAIAYHRGEGESFAGPVRDALGMYVREVVGRMQPAERKRYEEILATVKRTEDTRRAIVADGASPRRVRRAKHRNLLA